MKYYFSDMLDLCEEEDGKAFYKFDLESNLEERLKNNLLEVIKEKVNGLRNICRGKAKSVKGSLKRSEVFRFKKMDSSFSGAGNCGNSETNSEKRKRKEADDEVTSTTVEEFEGKTVQAFKKMNEEDWQETFGEFSSDVKCMLFCKRLEYQLRCMESRCNRHLVMREIEEIIYNAQFLNSGIAKSE